MEEGEGKKPKVLGEPGGLEKKKKGKQQEGKKDRDCYPKYKTSINMYLLRKHNVCSRIQEKQDWE